MIGYGVERQIPCCPGHDKTVWPGNARRKRETVERLHRIAKKRGRREGKTQILEQLVPG